MREETWIQPKKGTEGRAVGEGVVWARAYGVSRHLHLPASKGRGCPGEPGSVTPLPLPPHTCLFQGRTIHNTYLIQQYNTIRIIQQYARQATPAAVYNTVTVLGVKYTSDKVGGPNTPKYTTVVDLFCGPQIHKIHSEFSPTPNTQNTDITPRVTVVTSAVASRHGPGAAGPGRGRAPAAAAAPAPQRSCARAHSLPHHI